MLIRSSRSVFVWPYARKFPREETRFDCRNKSVSRGFLSWPATVYTGLAPTTNQEEGKKVVQEREGSNTRDSPSRIGWPTRERRHGILGCASEDEDARNARHGRALQC